MTKNILNISNEQAEELRKNSVLSKCRLSYPHLFIPQPDPDYPDKPKKYTCQFLWDKDTLSDEGLKSIKKGIVAAMVSHFGSDKSKWPAASKRKSPLRDGDEKFNEDPDKYAAYENCWFINASCTEKFPPQVLKNVKGRGVILSEASDIYGGCYGVPIVDFYGFTAKSAKGAILNQGVACAVISFCKTANGPPLGNGGPRDTLGVYADLNLGEGYDDSDLSDEDMPEDDDDFLDMGEKPSVKKKRTKKKVAKKPTPKAPPPEEEEGDFADELGAEEDGEEEDGEEEDDWDL